MQCAHCDEYEKNCEIENRARVETEIHTKEEQVR